MQSVVEARIAAMLDGPVPAANVSQAAVIVLDAATGAVRAMAGRQGLSLQPLQPRRRRAAAAGSSFKPFVWLAALEAGRQAR
jgi:penicillin-binding protein 1A